MPQRAICGLTALAMLLVLFGGGSAVGMQTRSEVADPTSAAVFYSLLESQGRFSELYSYLHPDAQATVPEAVVVGWYQNEFAPLGPGVITVTGVQWLTWTWPVTGVSYQSTAEVSFQQPFADGSVASDVVRLVEYQGEWRWFFGRSQDFIDEQIATYGGSESSVTTAPCEGAAAWWATTFPRIFPAEYLPIGVLPGEPVPFGRVLDCSNFDSRSQAQRFYEMGGPGDTYDLDADTDGIACEPRE